MKAINAEALGHHQTDFSVLAPAKDLDERFPDLLPTRIGPGLSRVSVSAESLEEAMQQVRSNGFVAHHIYVGKGESPGEVVLTDTIEFKPKAGTNVAALLAEHGLEEIDRFGDRIIARVTTAAGMNPIKLSHRLDEAGHDSEIHAATVLRAHNIDVSWHSEPGPGEPDAGLTGAWSITQGDPEVVIAVIDDGFDLGHPCFHGVSVSPKRWNFVDGNDSVFPEQSIATRVGLRPGDFHGTAVASLIFGVEGCRARGVAPRCTFLPIKFPVGEYVSQALLFEAFHYASMHAHIVCFSLGHEPSEHMFANLADSTVQRLRELTRSGGLGGGGLAIVCSAGNEGVPVLLRAEENRFGIDFIGKDGLTRIAEGVAVYTSFPTIDGIISVGSVTSGATRAAYSNLGPISMVAPSNNFHELSGTRAPYDQQQYPGQHLIAAQNRPGLGRPIKSGLPAADGNGLDTDYCWFGGTSAAAPIVAGTIGLMKSVDKTLTPSVALQILQASCTNDLASDPAFDDANLQGTLGTFTNSRSHWYGSGLLHAASAVTGALQQSLQAKNGGPMPNLILKTLYPGDADARIIKHSVVSGQLKAGEAVVLQIDIQWSHYGYPEFPLANVTAEFIRDQSGALFPTPAAMTHIKKLDMDAKTGSVIAAHGFAQAGDYFIRVAFGGHKDIKPAQSDPAGQPVKLIVAA